MSRKASKKNVFSQVGDNECNEESPDQATENNMLMQILQHVLAQQSRYDNVTTLVHKLEIENLEMKNVINGLKGDNSALLQRIETLEKASGGWTDASKATDGPVSHAAINDTVMTNITKELSARATKVQNVVIFGIDESTGTDKEKIIDLLQNGLGLSDITSDDIITHFRFGTQKENQPRPLKLKLNTQALKLKIISLSGKLSTREKYKRVYIRNDLTQIELKEYNERRLAKLNRPDHHQQPKK